MNTTELKVRDIVRWNGRLYDLKWIKPSQGICKIHNPNQKNKARLVQLNEVQFVARAIDSRNAQAKLYKEYLRRLELVNKN